MDHFWSVAKVALRFACAKQSKNLKRYLIFRVYTLKIIFLGIKLFQDTRLKLSASVWKRISKNPTKFQLIQTIVISIFSISCLIEMKFSEFSRNFFSNRCWKFQLFFLKKYFLGRSQYQNKKALFTDPIFSEGFGPDHRQAAAAPAVFYLAKSRQDSGLAGLTSNGGPTWHIANKNYNIRTCIALCWAFFQ